MIEQLMIDRMMISFVRGVSPLSAICSQPPTSRRCQPRVSSVARLTGDRDNTWRRAEHRGCAASVRGLAKVTCVVLLAAIASNLLQHAVTLLS
jgi:hypothetical protein